MTNEGVKGRNLRRLRCSFSLKTLLIVNTLFAVAIGWRAQEARQQSAVTKRIRELGGQVSYDFAPSDDELLRRSEEDAAAVRAGRRANVYVDRPLAPEWLVQRLGVDLFARVTDVRIGHSMIEDKDLAFLVDLPYLRKLSLSVMPRITNETLRYVGQLKRLESLSLTQNNLVGHGFTDEGYSHLAGLKFLVHLSLANSHLGDDALQHLSELTRLETLGLDGTRVTADGLRHIQGLTNLRHLGFSFAADDKSLAYLEPFKELEYIPRLSQATDKSLRHLRGFHRLRALDASDTQITDASLETIATMTKLEYLSLRNTTIGDQGMHHIGKISELVHLDLSGTHISDAGLKHLASLTALEGIDLSSTQVTDEGLQSLKNLPALRYVAIRGADVSDNLESSFPAWNLEY